MSVTIADMNPVERAVELVDVGVIDARTMLIACLKYMTHDEVEDMLRLNDFEEELDYE